MAKLFLLRHLKSQWNKENRFTGWTDVSLDKYEYGRAKELANKIFKEKISKIYSSALFRNQDTISRILEAAGKYPIFIHLDQGKIKKWGNYTEADDNSFKVFTTEKLNERYYGELQGKNKEELMREYGGEKVRLWRRSYDIAPPRGESLKDVEKRAVSFYKKYIEKDLKKGENILIVASHNSLRAVIKYIEKIPKEKIIDIELPFGALLEYEFNESLGLKNKLILV